MFVGCSGFVSVAAKGSGAALMAVPSPPDQRYACPAWALAALGRFPIIPSHCPLTWVGGPVCIGGGIEDILFGGGSGIIIDASMFISFSGCE